MQDAWLGGDIGRVGLRQVHPARVSTLEQSGVGPPTLSCLVLVGTTHGTTHATAHASTALLLVVLVHLVCLGSRQVLFDLRTHQQTSACA